MMDSKVDQDVREAAALMMDDYRPRIPAADRAESAMIAGMIRAGQMDGSPRVQAFARMKEAGRQAGLREAAEVVASMCTRTFVQDDAYTKLFEASEAITALSREGKQ